MQNNRFHSPSFYKKKNINVYLEFTWVSFEADPSIKKKFEIEQTWL